MNFIHRLPKWKLLLFLAGFLANTLHTNAQERLLLNQVDVYMTDDKGDGWNGTTLTIYNDSGLEVAITEMDCCASDVETFYLPDGCFTVDVEGGSAQEDVSWSIEVNGTAVLSGSAPVASVTLPVDDNSCLENAACGIDFDGTDVSYESCPAAQDGRVLLMASCPVCTTGLVYSLGGSPFQSSPVFENLAAGTYGFVIKDADSDACFITGTAEVLSSVGIEFPLELETNDIGDTGMMGNDYSYNPCENQSEGGTYAITGGGNNASPGTVEDAVAFLSKQLCGTDVEITVKMENSTTNGYGGIMIRESLAANAKQVSLFSNGSNVLRWEYRQSASGYKTVQAHSRPAPYWLKLKRQGDWFFAYYSTTGTHFTFLTAAYVPMDICVQIGLASFTYLPAQQCEATMTNLSIDGGIEEMDIPAPEINNQVNTEDLSVFPNPAQDMITIKLGEDTGQPTLLSLYNELGELVKQKVVQANITNTNWPVDELSGGMYLIKASRKDKIGKIVRFIKTR